MESSRFGKLLGGALIVGSLAFLAAILFGLAFFSASSKASTIGGWRVQWDSGPVFADTAIGGRILFTRDASGPNALGDGGMIMNSTYDGSYVGRQTQPNPDERHDQIAVPDLVDRFAYVSEWETGHAFYTRVCVVRMAIPTTEECLEPLPYKRYADPSFSPDGSKLAYIDDRNLYVWQVDTDDPPVLVSAELPPPAVPELPAKDPVFSADGNTLYFASSRETDSGLWSVPSDGSTVPVRLTGTTDYSQGKCAVDSAPEFRRVKDKLVFARNRVDCGPTSIGGIWQIDPDTAWSDEAWPQGEQLAEGDINDVFSEPTTSRDGELIAYAKKMNEGGGVRTRIHLLDGQGDRFISEVPARFEPTVDSSPTISPDGKYVAFARFVPPKDNSRRSGIFRAETDGSEQLQLTESYEFYLPDGGPIGPREPRLSLKLEPGSTRMVPGGAKAFIARVRNIGSAAANGVKVCVIGPRRLVIFPRKCRQVGTLLRGRTFESLRPVRVRRFVKPGRVIRLKVTVRSSNTGPVSRIFRLRVI